jgi:hypothetical protein
MALTLDIGDKVRLTVNIQVDGTDADPTILLLKWKAPKTAATIYTHGVGGSPTVKDSVGNYHADIDVAVQGLHYYRWEATGGVVGAEESTVTARVSQFFRRKPRACELVLPVSVKLSVRLDLPVV